MWSNKCKTCEHLGFHGSKETCGNINNFVVMPMCHDVEQEFDNKLIAEAKVELLYSLHNKRRLYDGEACNYRGVTCNQQNTFSDCVKHLIDEGEI